MKTKRRNGLIITLVCLICICLASGGWYIYDRNVDRSGWVEKNGNYYYQDFHARKVTGWQTIGESTYYFGENKVMAIGWQNIGGNRYYFGGDGRMHRSWLELDGSTYFLDEEGILVTGWLETALGRYFFQDDGSMYTGWLEDEDGSTYYLTDAGNAQVGFLDHEKNRYCFDENGVMITGWSAQEGAMYYFAEDGTMVTGTVSMDGKQYLLQEDGRRYTGWEELNGAKCYYGEDGSLVSGWAEIDGKRYFFDENHAMVTGWHQEGEYRYYLQEDGSAAVGPLKLGWEWYYFSPTGIHVVLVNRSNAVPSYYKTEMEVYPPWHEVAEIAYGPMMEMLTDLEAAGYTFEFNSAYRTIKNQQDVLEYYVLQYIDQGYDRETGTAMALTFVAPPGHSEHHLGLALDILDVEGEKPCLEWLHEHCWEYGFILRYTKEKESITGYDDEPWHFRYVGKEISMDMKDSGLCLEEYLGAA